MKKSLFVIFVSVFIIAAILLYYNGDFNEIDTTTIQDTTTTQTTTTQPTTENNEVDRDRLLEGNPTGSVTMNSVGGICLNIKEKYIGNKDVKYYTYNISLYNDVGDSVTDMKGRTTIPVRVTGPLYPNEELLIYGDPLFYSSTCGKINIEDMEFEYMDGTKEKIWFGYSWTVQY